MSLPKGNYFLNSKQKKILFTTLSEQFGIDKLPEGAYVQNAKKKVYLITQDVADLPLDELYVDALGLYLGAWQLDGFRLSIEGAQLLHPLAKKGVFELSNDERRLWIMGSDLPANERRSDFVIVTFGDDVLGCGKFRFKDDRNERTLLNYTPKARRLIVINE